MAINRFSKSAPTEFYFGTVPLQPLLMALQNKQEKFTEGMQAADELYNVSFDTLEQDRAEADKSIQSWRSGIDASVDRSKGDYSAITQDLYKIKRDITRAVSPGGRERQMIDNYKSFTEADLLNKQAVQQGLITQDQYEN